MDKKIVYIDLDGVMVDIEGYIKDNYVPSYVEEVGIGHICDIDLEMFHNSPPIEGAIGSFKLLFNDPRFEPYILSTAPWNNPESWKAKREWVEKNIGQTATKRLILSHRKDLLMGDYLIDDRDHNGAAEFKGEHIKFGTEKFKSWEKVIQYLTNQI